ncbi:hypothetical protein BU15DRAFT_83030 [Melanogaster broomeanus]|nr:hypothetical protein BU15DRAFT_83030 [Melanogaster broomeanus]
MSGRHSTATSVTGSSIGLTTPQPATASLSTQGDMTSNVSSLSSTTPFSPTIPQSTQDNGESMTTPLNSQGANMRTSSTYTSAIADAIETPLAPNTPQPTRRRPAPKPTRQPRTTKPTGTPSQSQLPFDPAKLASLFNPPRIDPRILELPAKQGRVGGQLCPWPHKPSHGLANCPVASWTPPLQ